MSLKEDRKKFFFCGTNDKILSFNAIRYSVFKLVMMISSIAFIRAKKSLGGICIFSGLDDYWIILYGMMSLIVIFKGVFF